MTSSPALRTTSDGVARISWGPDQGAEEVRALVEEALGGHLRVEALVDPDDESAQRTATWSGLRREGVLRGLPVAGGAADRVIYARLVTDAPAHQPEGFRALLNSFLPRKRAISQMLIREGVDGTPGDRVLVCQLTYKQDWDLPGGVVEVGESPLLAVEREVREELALDITPGDLLLTDWLPPWSGWDDAVCLVFDGGVHDASILEQIVKQAREIRSAEFLTLAQARERCADFTARRLEAAWANVGGGPAFTESGRPPA